MTGKGSPYIGEVLDAAFRTAQAVVVLLTPDDEVRLKAELLSAGDPDVERQLTLQARPNVLFEAGMAFGRDAGRTVIVEIGVVKPFSDIGGRHTVRLSNDALKRKDLAQRLTTAGCAVTMDGEDWLAEGDFSVARSPTDTANSTV
jgi:predicted nucleotide-binding protein